VPDEPTLGEVCRRLEAVHADLKEDMQGLARRLDGKVSADVLRLEQEAQDRTVVALTERVKALEDARAAEARKAEQDRKEAEARRRADRRWVIAAIVMPLLVALMQTYLTAKGAGS
jgi:hypothetical protein